MAVVKFKTFRLDIRFPQATQATVQELL